MNFHFDVRPPCVRRPDDSAVERGRYATIVVCKTRGRRHRFHGGDRNRHLSGQQVEALSAETPDRLVLPQEGVAEFDLGLLDNTDRLCCRRRPLLDF